MVFRPVGQALRACGLVTLSAWLGLLALATAAELTVPPDPAAWHPVDALRPTFPWAFSFGFSCLAIGGLALVRERAGRATLAGAALLLCAALVVRSGWGGDLAPLVLLLAAGPVAVSMDADRRAVVLAAAALLAPVAGLALWWSFGDAGARVALAAFAGTLAVALGWSATRGARAVQA